MTTDGGGGRRGRVFVILVMLSVLMGVLTAWQIFTGTRIQESVVGRDAGRATPRDDTYEGNTAFEGDTTLAVTIGHVELLYPGLNRTVPVHVKNPFDFGIRITRFDVSSLGTSACPASHLSIGAHPADGPVIEANGFVDTQTTIGLTESAPNSCQRENFKFSVTVTAVMS